MALTEKQQKFVDAFCEAVDNGVKGREAQHQAKQLAGYAPTTALRDIVTEDMVTEMLSYANRRMVMGIPDAINKLEGIMHDPTQDGAKTLLDTISQWLDRSGVIKKESREVIIKAPTGIVVMPPKAELDEPT